MPDSIDSPKRSPQYYHLTDPTTDQPVRISFAQGLHPNPRFYKYYWRVFHSASPFVGSEFFQHSDRICTYDAMELIKRLVDEGSGYIIYNVGFPRSGTDVPFNFSHKRWIEFGELITAPPFDDDQDREYQGHK